MIDEISNEAAALTYSGEPGGQFTGSDFHNEERFTVDSANRSNASNPLRTLFFESPWLEPSATKTLMGSCMLNQQISLAQAKDILHGIETRGLIDGPSCRPECAIGKCVAT